MGVSKNRGFPPKLMVKIMENAIKMDDLRVPLFLETSIYIYTIYNGAKMTRGSSTSLFLAPKLTKITLEMPCVTNENT